MTGRIVWCLLFLIGVSTLIASAPTRAFALCNVLVQLGLFLRFAHWPAWRSNRLSYVDFAWPAGVAALGVQLLVFAEALTWLTVLAAAIHLFVGLRMAFWAAHMYKPGVLTRDLPRYQYQRLRWARAGFRSERLSVQYEIGVQAMANMSFLALPALLIAADPAPTFTVWHATAALLWLAAYVFESSADWQKRRYARAHVGDRTGVCEVGLWRYSRHPNYFGQWLQWIALAGLSLPSLLALRDALPLVAFGVFALALIWMIHLMYNTLVYYTGAVPAEHFSRLKRPAYADYQQRVNRFWPGPRRNATMRETTAES